MDDRTDAGWCVEYRSKGTTSPVRHRTLAMSWDEAVATKEGLERHGWESAIVDRNKSSGISLPAGRDLASS